MPRMSRRNREKRAAKQKDRRRAARERTSTPWSGFDPIVTQEFLVTELRTAALCRCGEGEAHVDELLSAFGPVSGDLDVAADLFVQQLLEALWAAGWTPVDIHEVGRRRLDPEAAGYLDEAVVRQAGRYAKAALHPRWQAGLVAVAAGVDASGAGPQVRAWAARTGSSRQAALHVVVRLVRELAELPALERIVPPPGQRGHSSQTGGSGEIDEKMLARVRALLAKAESTQFAEEAEALSAKAQELMSRYALHQAVLDHDRGRRPVAAARRLWLDAPYAGAKAHLVQAVAGANRCRSVWRDALGVVTLLGAETDLDIVALLVTSLLVQANKAMLAAGRQIGRDGVSRTRSFRQSFLVAYATRIGERLAAADTAAATVEGAAQLLPVLAARSRATDDLTAELFPQVVERAVAVSNAAGWGAGRAAADLALFDIHSAVAG
jgi:Protein of unknown function (DUF2786)